MVGPMIGIIKSRVSANPTPITITCQSDGYFFMYLMISLIETRMKKTMINIIKSICAIPFR